MQELVASIAIGVALLGYVWWDTRRAHKRWLKRDSHWTGGGVRDPNKDRAFPPKRYEYSKKD